MINLSKTQESIVKADIGGAMQVLASAGAGKTRVLTERVRHILENTKNEGIIALTFTNKAAEEMSNRLSDVEDVQERCWIGTIHSVAQRVLEQYGNTIGLPSELHIYERDQDRKTLFLQSLRDTGIDIDTFLNISDEREKKQREKIINQYMEHFSAVKRELLTEDEIRQKYESNEKHFFKIYQAYQDALLESGGIDFDDILVYANRILLEQPWCAEIYSAKYKHLCVDEAQDLNKAQYEFIKSLCGDQIKSVLMVGDPNQMIYGFNGSSEDFLCNHFPKDFSASKRELKENYRSSKEVIHLANKLKKNSQVESDYALDGKSEFVTNLQDEQAEAVWIADQIQALLSRKTDIEIEGEISLEKMVVIGRNQYVFQKLEGVLTERKIPFNLKKGERLAEPSSRFGKVLDLGIRIRINPKDWVDGKKLCTTLMIDEPQTWGQSDILIQLAAEVKTKTDPFSQICSDLLTAIQNLEADIPNIPKLISVFSDTLGRSAIASSDEAIVAECERALLELKEFSQYWTTFRRKGLGESLGAFRNAMALGQLAEDVNTSGLTLSTVHTMKGLEKDIVFLMGMCEGTFPDYRAQNTREIEEERNNAFVAVTRSRRWIFITYPQIKTMPWTDNQGQPAQKHQRQSRFLTEMISSTS
ncbi:TPA: ATP-dependent helicase [Legionella pneumophila]|nr:ATP-dependent helicase [Legionella pneumophila]HBD7304467.1 ATP-dependent helicase [Legionella pneumophila]